MLRFLYYFSVIFLLKYEFVSCKIATLKVKQLDENIIHKKRNDTLELCRMYNEFDRSLYMDYNKGKTPNRFKRQSIIRPSNAIDTDNEKLNEYINADIVTDNQEPENDPINDMHIFKLHLQLPEQIGIKKDFAPKAINAADNNAPGNEEEEINTIKWQKHWKHGIVPYFIDAKTYDTYLSDIILKAFDYFEKATCIRLQRLRERPTDRDSLLNVEWLYITNPTGIRQCVHSNENKLNTGVQMVVFGYDCMSRGEILHEVMHVLGFSHEHVRADRDKYVDVLWDNIKPGYKKYFMTRNEDVLSHLPYDYASVMHYPLRAFSKNGQHTIKPRSNIKIGQRNELSETDAEKVNYVYNAECLDRNRQYLKTTCPKVIDTSKSNAADILTPLEVEINKYYGKRIWKFGVVTYKFKDNVEFSIEEKENIAAVIRHIEKETCIRFHDGADDNVNDKPKPDTFYDEDLAHNKDSYSANESSIEREINGSKTAKKLSSQLIHLSDVDYDQPIINGDYYKKGQVPQFRSGRRHADSIVVFERSDKPGCKCPKPGKPEGNEVLSIGIDCFNSANDLLHLFVHLLGLDHQHNMHDRDDYLHINWDQLSREAQEDLQRKLPPVAALGFPYDYQSVMHYPWLEIKHGVTNIMYPIWNDGWAMGHWQGLSSTDVLKLKLLYENECRDRPK